MADKEKPKVSLTSIKKALQGSVPDGGMVGKQVAVQGLGGPIGYVDKHRVAIPDGADGYSGTVRSHEARHLTFSPVGSISAVPKDWLYHPLMRECCQIAEDCYIETRPLPSSTPQSYKDMHRGAARKDLQDLLALDPEDKETQKAKILVGSRVLSMFLAYGVEDSKAGERQLTADGKDFARLLPDNALRRYVGRAVSAAASGNRAEAALSLFKMLGGDESELETKPTEKCKVAVSSGEHGGDGEEVGKALADACRDITGPASMMEIIELKRTVPTQPDKEPVFRTVYPDCGSRLNPARYVSAIVGGNARGLFIQNLTEQKGESVLLIDASGSMHVGNDELAAFCKASPNATVAFYCGTDDASRPKGWLTIYSKGGKRHDGPVDVQMRGNTVDLPALKWAMQQRGPITLVSDLGFCGVNHGEIMEAHGLVDRLKAEGRLTVIPSVAAAIRKLQGKDKVKA